MREMTFKHGGEEYTLAATYKASIEIADKVEDPIIIAREAALEAAMMKARMPYRPKFEFTVRNVPTILHAGLKAAGSELVLGEVEEIVFDMGFIAARLIVNDYMALIVAPKPSKPEVEPEDEIPDDEVSAGNG